VTIIVDCVSQNIELAFQAFLFFKLGESIAMFIIKIQSLVILNVVFDEIWHSRIEPAQGGNFEELDIFGFVDDVHDRSLLAFTVRFYQSFKALALAPHGEIFALVICLFRKIQQQFHCLHVLSSVVGGLSLVIVL